MFTAHHVRRLESRAQKRAVDAVVLRHRPELQTWGFADCAYLTHSTFGGVDDGFVEIVTLVTERESPDLEQRALALVTAHDDEVGAGDLTLPPGGPVDWFTGPAADAPAEVPASAFHRALCWADVPDFPPPAPTPHRLPDPAAPPANTPTVLGRTWLTGPSSVRDIVEWRLLERTLGADEHHAVLRPLREQGRIYSAVTRHLLEVGAFACGTIVPYDEALEREIHRLLDAYRPDAAALAQARRALWFDLQVQRTDPFHALAPYALVERGVTFERVRDLIASVGLADLERALAAPWRAVRWELTA